MNTTYMIGNGFDLGLGLKTSYKDFLEWFLASKGKDNKSNSYGMTRLCEVISKNVDTWSDAELAFAQLDFKEILPDTKNIQFDILQLLTEFKYALDSYLETQQQLFQMQVRSPKNDLWKIGFEFRDNLVGSLVKGEQILEKNEKQKLKLGDRCDATIINFNYTSVFDELFRCGQYTVESGVVWWRSSIELNIKQIHYVHGNLKEKNTLFGVSAAAQINDDKARHLAEHSGFLVKSSMDKEENGNNYAAAVSDLQISDVIVLFGLSFGASDKFWWRKLVDLLLSNEKLRIYIFPYERDVECTKDEIARAMLRTTWRSKFISSIRDEFSDEKYLKIQENFNRVIVMPYAKYKGESEQERFEMDPWNLSYFRRKILGK